jgi:hypothetical protein
MAGLFWSYVDHPGTPQRVDMGEAQVRHPAKSNPAPLGRAICSHDRNAAMLAPTMTDPGPRG